ncbi:CatA-like O-acetyltransferase [Sagittula salina]|uniref:Chloramphenicol acetyltransferase n=1 Tax=Sagittula salina TaxID=2820268 RepID=A0A940MKY1_9RHOB|nr:CatA-like O-acetyltransferase [Sagittula salina]MBP0481665.1 chloramphenicol acetyltransferase [Sagittula salina]
MSENATGPSTGQPTGQPTGQTTGHTAIDLDTWDRAQAYRWFRAYAKPHYAVTCRLDVTRLMRDRKPAGVSPFRASLWAIGAALSAVPDMRTRFRDDTVVRYDRVALSFTVARPGGGFGYAYQDWQADFAAFDRGVQATIATVRAGRDLSANTASDAVAYLSCLPWLDFTALDHATPGPEDCIPRVSWGRIVPEGDRYAMAVNVQVNHAVTDGEHLGSFYSALQEALDSA